jgi:hypothetical protein
MYCDEFGKRTGPMCAHELPVRTEVCVARATEATRTACDQWVHDHLIAGDKPSDLIASADHLASKFVPHHQRRYAQATLTQIT